MEMGISFCSREFLGILFPIDSSGMEMEEGKMGRSILTKLNSFYQEGAAGK